jgi:hypothetical protein
MINTELFISQNHYERFFPSKSKQEFSWSISYIANPEEFFSKTISSSHYLQGLKELSESAPGMSITIEGQTLSYEESGRVPDTDYITAVLEFLTKIVLQVERLDQYRLSY